jgi:hypothetical protein
MPTATTAERRREQLVPVKQAARVLGRSSDAVRDWINAGVVPAIRTPGAQWSVYGSWLTAVLDSARPGVPGDMSKVTELWWADRLPAEEVA